MRADARPAAFKRELHAFALVCAQELAEHRRHEYRALRVVIRLIGLPQRELFVREELGLRARARRRDDSGCRCARG